MAAYRGCRTLQERKPLSEAASLPLKETGTASISLGAARQRIAECLSGGEADSAADLIALLRARFPSDYRLAVLSGRTLLAKGDVGQARDELEKAAAVAPDDREIQAGLASCGVEDAQLLLADLPPLPSVEGERPSITAAGLGHLYLRQFLLPHCTAQLGPIWQTRRDRPDIALALAEAHWRLRENDAAAEICHSLLQAWPDCLKANLIMAQIRWVSERRDEANPFVERVLAVDPEGETAEDLYEWLIVRDPGLVPLRRREVLVEVPDAEPEPIVAGVSEDALASEPLPSESAASPAPAVVEEVLATQPVEAEIEQPAPFWEQPAVEQNEPEPGNYESESESESESKPEPESQFAAIEPGIAESAAEPALEVYEPGPESEPAAVDPDIADTAPEPALEPLEVETHRAEPFSIAWLEMGSNGQIGPRPTLTPEIAAAHESLVAAWNESCRRMTARLRLGTLRASSIDSPRGAIQLVHESDRAYAALAPVGTNLGLVRARLRQLQDSSKENVSN